MHWTCRLAPRVRQGSPSPQASCRGSSGSTSAGRAGRTRCAPPVVEAVEVGEEVSGVSAVLLFSPFRSSIIALGWTFS